MATSRSNDNSQSVILEKLLAIVKPDAVQKCAEIENIIVNNGFTILQRKKILLTRKEATDFYIEHEEKSFFQELVNSMVSGPVLVMTIAGNDALNRWSHIAGPSDPKLARAEQPDSIRGLYGGDKKPCNAVHASDSLARAETEIQFFFPGSTFESTLRCRSANEYLAKFVSPILIKGLVELRKAKPENPIIWLAHWLQENNPNKPLMQ